MARATTTEKPIRKPPVSHPKRRGSPLRPHLETIKELRSCQKTWPEISEHLKQNGISADPSTIRRFFNRACEESPRPAEGPADQSFGESEDRTESAEEITGCAGSAVDTAQDVQVLTVEELRPEDSSPPKRQTSLKPFKQRFLESVRQFIARFRRPKIKDSLSDGARGRWPLELPLVRFSERSPDVWTLADACQGVAILGENGSGKTSASGRHLARQYLKAGFGGLVLCFKTDEAELWRRYLKETGREADGRFFGADEAFRFNFMDYEAAQSGIDFVENLVTLLADVASIQRRAEATGAEAHFWLPQKKKLLRNAIGLLLLAKESIQLRTLYQMIVASPKHPDQVKSLEWQKDNLLFDLLERAETNERENPEWELICNYWMIERPALASKTRETIDADFTGMFDPLTRGKIGELFGTGSDLSPDHILAGKVVVIDIPVAKYREIGQYAALIWAQLFQRAVDRRSFKPPNDRPVFLWEDEAHYFTIEQDAEFQTTARSKGISVVRLTQNLPNFLDAYGAQGKHKVDTLLGNHATKIFHRNGDPTTNEWASKVIAKETTYKHSISTSGSVYSAGGANSQSSVTEVEEDSCPPKEFIGLKNGGPKNNYIVEGILFQSGRLWKGDQRWVVRKFRQT
jgi:hypothetical protein